MTYSTLMVHLDLGGSNEGPLRIAADLARRFGARVIGIAACQPVLISYGDGYMSPEVMEQDRDEIEKETEEAATEFHAALTGTTSQLEWRSAATSLVLADYLADQARAADLIITGPDKGQSQLDPSRRLNIGELVMRAGRPVLVVPPTAVELSLEHAVIGWKEARETRRAVLDALPLLRKAGRVTVVEISAEVEMADARDHLEDVVSWLKRHGVAADFLAAPATGDDTAQLDAIARDRDAGLLVAGAYGHNRLREWVLGGVTRDLLLRPSRCSLMSH